jgi:hypothetical protein
VALYSTLSTTYIDISLNTIGSRLGVATVQVSTRLKTVIIRLNQYTFTVKFKVYKIITTRRSLNSVNPIGIYKNRLHSGFTNCLLLFLTTTKPNIQDPVELQNIVRR